MSSKLRMLDTTVVAKGHVGESHRDALMCQSPLLLKPFFLISIVGVGTWGQVGEDLEFLKRSSVR